MLVDILPQILHVTGPVEININVFIDIEHIFQKLINISGIQLTLYVDALHMWP